MTTLDGGRGGNGTFEDIRALSSIGLQGKYILPIDEAPDAGSAIVSNGTQQLVWESDAGIGNVNNLTDTSVNGHLVRYVGTTGKLIDDSGIPAAAVTRNPLQDNSGFTTPPEFKFEKSRAGGTVDAGDVLGKVSFSGYSTFDGDYSESAYIAVTATESFIGGAGADISIFTTANGATVPTEAVKIDRNNDMAVIGDILSGDGTVANPSKSFISDDTMGFYKKGVSSMGVSVDGNLTMEFTNDGLIMEDKKLQFNIGGVKKWSINAETTTFDGLFIKDKNDNNIIELREDGGNIAFISDAIINQLKGGINIDTVNGTDISFFRNGVPKFFFGNDVNDFLNMRQPNGNKVISISPVGQLIIYKDTAGQYIMPTSQPAIGEVLRALDNVGTLEWGNAYNQDLNFNSSPQFTSPSLKNGFLGVDEFSDTIFFSLVPYESGTFALVDDGFIKTLVGRRQDFRYPLNDRHLFGFTREGDDLLAGEIISAFRYGGPKPGGYGLACEIDVGASENWGPLQAGSFYKISTTDNGGIVNRQKLLIDTNGITINNPVDNNSYTLPNTRPTSGQFLYATNSTGTLGWSSGPDHISAYASLHFNGNLTPVAMGSQGTFFLVTGTGLTGGPNSNFNINQNTLTYVGGDTRLFRLSASVAWKNAGNSPETFQMAFLLNGVVQVPSKMRTRLDDSAVDFPRNTHTEQLIALSNNNSIGVVVACLTAADSCIVEDFVFNVVQVN